MKKKQHGSFSKVGKLITVLQKCNGKTAFGEGNSLISPGAAKLLLCGFLLALTAGLAAGVYYIQPFVAGFISAKGAAQGLMLVLLIMTFALAIKDIVTVLYTANDLELLIPLPFSASQIVMAKLAVVAVFPVCLCFVVLNGVCLGFGIREGAGLAFYIGSVLSSTLIPVTGIFAATLLVVLIFRIFGFIRNRDITVALGGIFTFEGSISGLLICLLTLRTTAAASAIFPRQRSRRTLSLFHILFLLLLARRHFIIFAGPRSTMESGGGRDGAHLRFSTISCIACGAEHGDREVVKRHGDHLGVLLRTTE